jgi:diguanylate cyclase (GGDEF)-like protein
MLLSMAKESVEFDYKQAALVDPLTGIPNRRAFVQNASGQLAVLGGRPASCLLFDLDNFKAINDRHGHDGGDRVLTLFGQVLADHLPARCFGRLGGEEFAAILPLDGLDAKTLANTIRRRFAAASQSTLGGDSEATVSVGCATGTGASAEALLKKADSALYRAKSRGRNMVIAA